VENVFCNNCGARLVPLTAAPDSEKPAGAHPIKGLSLPTKTPPPPSAPQPENASPSSEGAIPEPTDKAASPAEEATSEEAGPAEGTKESGERAGFEQNENAEDTETPDWLRVLRSSMPAEETAPPSVPSETGPAEGSGEEETEVPDWLSRLRAEPPVEEEPTARRVSEDAPDWIKQLQSQEANAPVPPGEEEDVPDWIKQLHAAVPSEATPGGHEQESGGPSIPTAETAIEPGAGEVAPQEPSTSEVRSDSEVPVPGWIEHAASAEVEEPASVEESQLPGWLDQSSLQSLVPPSLGQEEPQAPTPMEQLEAKGELPKEEEQADLPSWLLPSTQEQTPSETPTWIEQVTALPAAEETAPVPASEEEIPDWIKELRAREPAETPAETVQEVQGAETESLIQALEEEVGAETPLAPAPVSGMEKPPEEEVPDWLRLAIPEEQVAEIPAEAEAPAIEPARPEEFPEWIAALRPSEQTSLPPAELAGEPSEEVGPLAGLRGVLPLAVAVAEPHVSTKGPLQTETAAGAHLFDSILATPAGEAELPVAAKAKRVWTFRPFVYLLLALAVIVPFVLPFSLAESLLPIRRTHAEGFYEMIQGLPANSTVLVAFDYDPSMAGEMDLQANAIVRDLIGRRIKILAISTLETGPQIAQRILGTAAEEAPNYRYGSDYANLGYLAGHEAGLSQLATSGLSVNSVDFVQKQRIGSLPITANVKSLRDVALVIELAGSEESLKMWMEQVQPRAGTRIAAGVSAGVEPRAQAHYDAKQIVALLSGLVGAAQYEILSNRPGLAVTSVDAQSAAQTVLLLVIVLGNIAYWTSRARGRETARAQRGKVT
jgi:hypothetical protein